VTNNKLCDFLGGFGCAVTFISMVLIFFGENCWIGAITGIVTMIISQVNYN